MEHVCRTYRMGEATIHALDDVSLDVHRGEFVAVMGPSGSGKSTMLNVLGCLDTPSSGSYLLEGEEVARLDDDALAEIRNRRIGFIFQTFNLLPKLTATQNVELPLVYAAVPPGERRALAEAALERVGLADRRGHRPNELSGGQRQRVAVARALARRPALVLADEPTGNLDSESSSEIMDLLEDLHRSGNTIVTVTHDAEIAARCERTVRMRDGRIVEGEVARAV